MAKVSDGLTMGLELGTSATADLQLVRLYDVPNDCYSSGMANIHNRT